VDDYLGHLQEFRRILSNLEAQSSAHPLTRETIVALSQKLDRDESLLNADRLERSIRATVEATETLDELDHYEREVLNVFQEITTRKRHELERKRFRTLLDHCGEAILVVEPHTGHFVDANQIATRMLGYSREELLELSLNQIEVGLSLTPPTAWTRWVEALRESSLATRVEGVHRNKDGGHIPVEASVNAVVVDGQELLLIVARDVTERKHAEGRIRRQWAFFSRLVHRSVDGILAFDRNLNVTYWNPAAERLFGIRRTQVVGHNLLEALPALKELGEDRFFRDALSGTIAISRNRPFTNAETGRQSYFDGYYSPLSEDAGEVLGGIGILRDVTERRETQLRQAREAMARMDQQRLAQLDVQRRLERQIGELKAEVARLESEKAAASAPVHEVPEGRKAKGLPERTSVKGIGLVASGVAREVTPLMTGILSQTGLALAELPSDSPLRRGMEEIEEAALSTSAITATLSGLAENGNGPEGEREQGRERNRESIERVSIAEVLSEAESSLQHRVPPDVVLDMPMNEEALQSLPYIEADGRHLRDLLFALVQNAAEAMHDDEADADDTASGIGGTVRIEAGVMDVDAEMLARAYLGEGKSEGKYVFLEVSDTGKGMSPEVLEKAFVPFFTTKRGHRGLGLASVLGTLREAGGAIIATSDAGGGSIFRVLFPIA
jgi:PAS domain S-box-containing protein